MHNFFLIAILFSLLSVCNLSFSILEAATKTKQEKQSNDLSFGELLLAIDDQLQDSNYSEKLYNFRSDAGLHRLLILNNPERKTLALGMLNVRMRVIVGYEADLPEYCLKQIEELIERFQLKGILYSAGTFNGKTIFELFGY